MTPPRVSLVTLGVRDVVRCEAFYRALGWEVAVAAGDDFRVFRTQGALLALYDAAALRKDAGAADRPDPAPTDFRGVACAVNVEDPAEVDATLAAAAAAGGRVLHPGEHADWGGYSGYFADPEGHAWEVAYNPDWPIGADGRPTLP